MSVLRHVDNNRPAHELAAFNSPPLVNISQAELLLVLRQYGHRAPVRPGARYLECYVQHPPPIPYRGAVRATAVQTP